MGRLLRNAAVCGDAEVEGMAKVIRVRALQTQRDDRVNPVDYLADVLLRIQTHPAARIDELLPQH